MKYNPLAHLEKTCLLLLLILIILPSTASGQETYRFERMWPTLLQPWYFKYPEGIAVGPDGSVYIVDSGFCRIQKFTSDGQFITRWGKQGTGDGEFGYYDPTGPSSIAVDGNGYVYVTDKYNNRIQRFTSAGVFLNKWGEHGHAEGQFIDPSGIAVDQNGFVYVADCGNCRIQKFTFDGSFVTKWDCDTDCDESSNRPIAITVDTDNYVYVADQARIQKFTSDGTFILKWDNDFPGGARWSVIRCLAVDENRQIYIADQYHYNEEGQIVIRVQKIDSEGRLIITWERKVGFNKDELNSPSGIALDGNGHIYLSDFGNNLIKKLDMNFETINVWASYTTGDDALMQPEGICVTDNGTIYVTDRLLNVIHIFSPEGSHTTWGNPGQFNDPINITVDHNGNIYVCDRRCVLLDGDDWDCDINYRIQKFTPDRQYITTISGGVEDDLWFRPVAIALDRSGNVYVVDQTGEVVPCDIGSTVNCWEERRRIQKFIPNTDGTVYTPDIPWETWGNGNTFFYPSGIAVGRDTAGTEYVYVADTWNDCIHKFTLTGDYITTWFEAAPNDTFNMPKGLASDDNGNVYIADSWNCRFLKFSSDGELITSLGSCGSSSNQMSEFGSLAVDSNEKVFVADTYNSRIQVFTKVESIENTKAIIVAGGGSYGNSLWDATQMCASFAYRALTCQGFTKYDISYLSEDTDLDLDGNRIIDDGIVVPSNVSLRDAIQDAAENNAENLVLYLTDHGGADENGDGTFNLGGSEILTASGLESMLDSFPGRIIVIIDACQSGSFINALEGANRIIITSTQPDERAKFINQGTISFSNFFWTSVFNGSSIEASYNAASGAVNVLAGQHPDISCPLDINPGNVYIGNGVAGMVGEAPVIGSRTTSPSELHLETQAVLSANAVTDPDGDGIARVWAVIWPPHFDPGSVDNPLTDLPSVDLLPVAGEEGNYEITYNGFISMGIYNIAVYAMDRKGNTSQPNFMTLSRNLTRRAVIVGGGTGGELNRTMIEKNTSLAYNAFLAQRYEDDNYYDDNDNIYEDDICFMSVTGRPGYDGAPSVRYLGAHLEDLANNASIDNLDLTIYLIGAGDTGTFAMNDDGETLAASQLYGWLNDIQRSKQSRVTLIYDGNKSGSFIPAPETIPPVTTNRIIITSTGPESAAYFKTEGSVSFSSFFWDRIAAGETIGDAFIYAKGAISYCTQENDISFSCYRPQHPLIDANSNGIASERDDYEIAKVVHLGDGVLSGDIPPKIGSVSVLRDGSSLTITAHNVSSTNPVEKVWAVIRPISYCPGDSEGVPLEVLEQELFDHDGDGTYAYTLNVPYACKVTVYAMSRAAEAEEPDISEPLEPIINQPGGDIYEPDDEAPQANVIVVNHPSPQPHTFHHPDDADWVKFYGVVSDYAYTIEAGNLMENCPVLELYKEDNLSEPIAVVSNYPVNNKVWFDFRCTEDDIYYVKLFRGDCAYSDGEMSYDLQVYDVNKELTGQVEGKVEDSVSGAGIDGAVITSDGVGVAISTRGGQYLMSEMPGSWTLTARKDGYVDASYGFRIDTNDQRIRQDIDMQPRDTGGCRTAADCDDGLYCNGTETCVNRTCRPGTTPCADDGVFCNGTESCNETNDVCEHAGNPCPAYLTCDEDLNACTGCMQDAECNDGRFCNGVERCEAGTCKDGTGPCAEGVECDEDADACLIPEISVIPHTIMQSRWMPLPFFLSIRGTNTHFSGASKANFSPPSIMNIPFVINQQAIFCMGLIMPAWITGQLGDSIEVSVKTNLENATGSIEVNMMPFMLGEESR